MADGSVYKRCGCRHPQTGKPLNNDCPRLRRPNRSWNPHHGQWAYQLELPPAQPGNRRRQLRRCGLPSHTAATAELDQARELLALAGRDRRRRTELADLLQTTVRAGQPLPAIEDIRRRLRGATPLAAVPSVGTWLQAWLAAIAAAVDANTLRGYESHVRVHLTPHLGDIPLDQLRADHIRTMFAAIDDRNAEIVAAKASADPAARRGVAGVRPTGPATKQRIRATLRKAINDALVEEVYVGVNPAALVKTPGDRELPMVWEDERVARWQTTGEVPGPVMVWTDVQLAAFLDHAADHDPELYPLLHLTAYRGLRRGEACGLRDTEVRLRHRELTVNHQIATHGYTPVHKRPKSRAGNRDIALDADTVTVLTTYLARRRRWQSVAGDTWPDTGMFFVRPEGHPWHPNAVTQRFRKLVRTSGLPPIRLHDLRHGAATLALAAGVDIKILSEQLGHTTTTLTRDTYQSATKEMHRNAADAVAETVRRHRPAA